MTRRTTWQAAGALLACCVLVAFGLVGSVRTGVTGVPAKPAQVFPALATSPFALPDQPLEFVDDRGKAVVAWRSRIERSARRLRERTGIHVQIATLRAHEASFDRMVERLWDRGTVSPARSGRVGLFVDVGRGEVSLRRSASLRALFPPLWLGALDAHELAPAARSRELGPRLIAAVERLEARAVERARLGAWTPPESVRGSVAFQAALEAPLGALAAAMPVARGDAVAAERLRERISGTKRARYAPATRPLASVAAALRSWSELAGDPTLDLFTPGSQCMRARRPLVPAEAWRRADAIEASGPLEVAQREGRAVVRSRRPAPGFEPLLLHRTGGLWRVDSAEMARRFGRMRDGEVGLAVEIDPETDRYAFGLGGMSSLSEELDEAGFRRTRRPYLEPVDLERRHPLDVVARLESQLALEPSPGRHFEVAEILHRNCAATADALPHYERAAALAPGERSFVATAASRGRALGLELWATPYLRALGEEQYETLANAYRNASELEEARHFYQLAIATRPSESARRALRLLSDLR